MTIITAQHRHDEAYAQTHRGETPAAVATHRGETATTAGPVFNSHFDMNSLLLAFNKLISKMRDQQRDNALQQQQTALKLQEKGYSKQQESIASSQKAATVTATLSGLGAAVGMGAGGLKATSAVKSGNAETKINKVRQELSRNENLTVEKAFENVNQQQLENRGRLGKLADKFGSTPQSMEALEKKRDKYAKVAGYTDLGTAVGGVFNPIGQGIASTHTATAQAQNVDADRFKTIQQVNEKEHATGEERARESSRQLRETQQDLNRLYAQVVSAVRFS